MADAETRLKVEEPDREQARNAADFLERACAFGHGGFFLTTTDGETATAEMPVALLLDRLGQRSGTQGDKCRQRHRRGGTRIVELDDMEMVVVITGFNRRAHAVNVGLEVVESDLDRFTGA